MVLLGDPHRTGNFHNTEINKNPMKDKITKATYLEQQASLFGACFVAFGLGVLFANYFQSIALMIILIGIILHSWGMYKIHQKINEYVYV